MEAAELDFNSDQLGRQAFADRLATIVKQLAQSTFTAGGKVIAVDAPWGTGKSWVAQRLPAHFRQHSGIGACIYVDVFQFDFHTDPFAVLASAVLAASGDGAKGKLKLAAKDVLRATLPALGKGLAKASAKTIGIDVGEIADAVADASGKLSEKAIDSMLDAFERQLAAAGAFKEKLKELTAALDGPLVIVLDELDRCRPDFALQILERIKHLFDVGGVVFALFTHMPALVSAVHHTYGSSIDAPAYLRKFISVQLSLPTSASGSSIAERVETLREFVIGQAAKPRTRDEQDFLDAVPRCAAALNASLRDIQSALLSATLAPKSVTIWSQSAAYLHLLRSVDRANYDMFLTDHRAACRNEYERLSSIPEEDFTIDRLRDVFSFAADPAKYFERSNQVQAGQRALSSKRECEDLLRFLLRVRREMRLEHVRV